MARRIPMSSGAEYDAFGRWRRVYCYLQRAGATDKIKRGYRRRERRTGKSQLRSEND